MKISKLWYQYGRYSEVPVIDFQGDWFPIYRGGKESIQNLVEIEM